MLGRLHNIQKGINTLNKLLPEKRESLKEINDDIRVYLEEIRNIDGALAQAHGSVYTTLQADRQTKLEAIEALSKDAADLSDAILAAQIEEADVLIADNAGIAASAVYETNEKTVNGIYLATLAKGILNFSITQQNTLKTIAEQCPLTGGVGVYQARSLYALVERVYYDDEQLCTVAQQMQAPQGGNLAQTNSHFKTYPNPNTGAFMFEYDLENDAVLLLYDLAGRAVHKQALTSGKGSIPFSTEQLHPGMYLLKVFANASVLHAEKIIVIR